MRKIRYTEEQIVGNLKESEVGLASAEQCRKNGIREQTFCRWKAKRGGLEVSEAQRLRHLEEENRKLKQLAAEQALDIIGFKAVGYRTPQEFAAKLKPECSHLPGLSDWGSSIQHQSSF
jgi:putative transposase